jgi:hypothetical protein
MISETSSMGNPLRVEKPQGPHTTDEQVLEKD